MQAFLLKQIAVILLGSVNWKKILEVVLDIDNSVYLGEEKRRFVVNELKTSIPSSLLNFGIETAVQYLRRK